LSGKTFSPCNRIPAPEIVARAAAKNSLLSQKVKQSVAIDFYSTDRTSLFVSSHDSVLDNAAAYLHAR
jgi:hypothetical protein